MKRIIIIAAVILLVLAIGLVYLAMHQAWSPGTITQPGGGTLPVSTSTMPTGTTLALGTKQGSVTVNNFYASAVYITDDGQTVVLGEKPQYSIAYNVNDSSFIITLLSTPVQAARQAAEAAFLASLGASKQDACKLNVVEGVPEAVSDQYVGRSFPLSFCGTPINP